MDFKLEQATEILSQTPAVLKALLKNLSDDWTRSEEDLTDWSPCDVVGHLIHADETNWIPRAKMILTQGENLTFEAFDRFGQFEKFKDKPLGELLEAFEERRAESLQAIAALNLTPAKLALKAVHPDLGEVTLENLLATWAVHDLTHIRQIVGFMARRYTDAVGVWKNYLSILK